MTPLFSENAGRGEPVAPPGADDAIPLLTDVVLLADAPTPAGAPRALEDDWAILAIKVETSVAERLMTHASPLLDGALDDLLPPLLARAAAAFCRRRMPAQSAARHLSPTNMIAGAKAPVFC